MKHQLSIAPMIDWSYSHFRVFMRILAPNCLVYTEMQTVGAVLNNPDKALDFSEIEHPIALQLGGSDPHALAQCSMKAQTAGFDEININLGCPSDRVQAGQFGACLMRDPIKVSDCIKAMKDVTSIPVTAKTRIGIDHDDSYEYFRDFVAHLVEAGIDSLVVHARKAWLNGLSPKQNRTVPPLHYDYVHRIKKEYPSLPVVINGNITQLSDIDVHLQQLQGVMIGRLACDNPYQIATIHHHLYPEDPLKSRTQILEQYFEYLNSKPIKSGSLSLMIKPIMNLYHGQEGARAWKQYLMGLLQSRDGAIFDSALAYSTSIRI